MKLLAMDTSTEACSVALAADDEVWHRFEVCPRQHNRRLSEMIREVLDESGMKVSDLDAVVCGVGPGSFTGIRIAVGMAQGLAAALSIPVAAVRGTESMARQALATAVDASRVLVAMDARMAELYWAVYERGAAGEVLPGESERLARPDEIELLHTSGCVACGDAWQSEKMGLRGLAGPDLDILEGIYPDARIMLEIARSRGEYLPAEQLTPLYLRARVAEKSA